MGSHRPATKVVNGRALVFEKPPLFDYMDTDQARRPPPARTSRRSNPESAGRSAEDPLPLYLATVMGLIPRLRRRWTGSSPTEEWTGVHCPAPSRSTTRATSTPGPSPPSTPSVGSSILTTFPGPTAAGLQTGSCSAVLRLKQHRNFSGQDQRIVENVEYENPRSLLRVRRLPRPGGSSSSSTPARAPTTGRAGE